MDDKLITSPLAEFSMYIHKVSVDKSAGGVMRWRAVASDTSPDLYAEKMSNELFDDFIHRIDSKSSVAEPFNMVLGEDWGGGMPYISISHYKSGTNKKNVPGDIEQVYRDGDRLKAVGNLHDSNLGRAVFKSLCDDLYSEKAKQEGKIRISIGFLDLEHRHTGEGTSPDFVFTRSGLNDICPKCKEGIGNKVYAKGQLVHLALTRVPVNPRTDMEVSKAMAIETKKEDAASIIGVELSETLEEKSLVASDALVIKSEETEVDKAKAMMKHDEMAEGETPAEDNPAEETAEKKKVVKKAKIAQDKQSEELTYDEPDEEKREQRRNRPAGERSLLQLSVGNIESKIEEMKSQGVPAETALREIQPLYAALGELVKKSIMPEKTSTDIVATEVTELVSAVKSLAESLSTFQQNVSTELATLKAQVATKSVVSQSAPEPRSLSGRNVPPSAKELGRPLTISEIAYKSTFS